MERARAPYEGPRQGDLLTREAAAGLQLTKKHDGSRRVVVISHDCDLANDAEVTVEVMVAETVTRDPDPQLSYAKNPRRLHLVYDRGPDAGPFVLELRHPQKHTLPRPDFVRDAVRDDTATLTAEAKRVLKQWLAARYGRPAFPDAFEERLRKAVRGRTVERCIARILAPDARYIIGLFFDLGEQRSIEITDGESYGLSLSIVYDAREGGRNARQAAEDAAAALRDLFKEAYGMPCEATEIALDACEALADTHMTLADLRRVDQWRLEHVSLQDTDQGEFLPVGELPA